MDACLSSGGFMSSCPGHVTGVPAMLFAHLINSLLKAQCDLAKPDTYPEDAFDRLESGHEFDFVVVGAGSAGAVVASRLSENPDWNVLLVEAGGNPTVTSEIPALLFFNQGSEIDWDFCSEPEKNSLLGMMEHRCKFPRGKVLGGSSSINAMLYVRGNAEDYDEWERMGNKGWGYKDVLTFFKKSEGMNGYTLVSQEKYEQVPEIRKQSKDNVENLRKLAKEVSKDYHSMDGELSVSQFPFDQNMDYFRNILFRAFEDIGLPHVNDINGKSQIGYAQSGGTTINGKRGNTAKQFLRKRPNLTVIKHSVATKILIDKDKKAYGVEVNRNGDLKKFLASKEVVISAGAINSPQLLMASGIGPRKELEEIGVEVVHELKGVGENLQDHLMFIGAVYTINKKSAKEMPEGLKLDALYEFLTRNGGGTLSTIGLTDMIGFINTTDFSSPIPDIQFHTYLFSKRDKFLLEGFLNGLKVKPEIKAQYHKHNEDAHLLMLGPTILRPKSVGKIKLVDGNVFTKPKIITNFLNEQEDVDTIVRGIKLIQDFDKTVVKKALTPELIPMEYPLCSGMKFRSDEYWQCAVRHLSHSLYHPVGTCKMGSDEMAVVDDELRVHGVSGLRVADASIMPVIVRGNTNAPCIMIGEKLAEMVKRYWKKDEGHTEL